MSSGSWSLVPEYNALPKIGGLREALLTHLHSKASAPGADQSLVQEDIGTVSQAWAAIWRRFRQRGVRAPSLSPRQLLLGHSFELVPKSMTQSKNQAWLQPLSHY